MPTPHNRKPLYYRSSNPGVPEVSAIAGSLYQWDETGSIPAEVLTNKAFMPPAEIPGETTIWSDSYTLGYTDSVSAGPMFWSDGGLGDAKVLKLINHVARKLGQPVFSDLVAAKAWAESASGIYTSWAAPASSAWDNTLTFEAYTPDWNFTDPNAMNFSTDTWANTAYQGAPYSLWFWMSRIAATSAFGNLAIGSTVRVEQSSGDYYEGSLISVVQNQVGNGAGAIQPTYQVRLGNPTSYSGIWNASLPTVVKFNN